MIPPVHRASHPFLNENANFQPVQPVQPFQPFQPFEKIKE
jgi:hypothetical protein